MIRLLFFSMLHGLYGKRMTQLVTYFEWLAVDWAGNNAFKIAAPPASLNLAFDGASKNMLKTNL